MSREYTKAELRNRHKQQLQLHAKRSREAQRDARVSKRFRTAATEVSVSQTQLGKAVTYLQELDFDRLPWTQVRDLCAEKVLADKSGVEIDKRQFASAEEAMLYLYDIGHAVISEVSAIALKVADSNDPDLLWAKKMFQTGKLNDKAASAAILLQACPVLAFNQLDSILNHIKAINRTEVAVGVDTFLAIWENDKIVPANEELRVLKMLNDMTTDRQELKLSSIARKCFIAKIDGKYHMKRLESLGHDGPELRLLLCLMFEHHLVQVTSSVIQAMFARTTDSVDAIRKMAYDLGFSLAQKPTMREASLRMALRFLSDRSSKLAAQAEMKLGRLLLSRKELRRYVFDLVEQFIWMQKVDAIALRTRDSVRARQGRIVPKSVIAAQLNLKARRATNEIVKALKGKVDENLQPATVKTSMHTTVIHALKFISGAVYGRVDEEFVHDQTWRYLRLMQKMTAPIEAQKLSTAQRKQIHFAQKNRKEMKAGQCDIADLKRILNSARGEKMPYVCGLAESVAGSVALSYVLVGLRRLLSFCSDELLNKLRLQTALSNAPTEQKTSKRKEKAAAVVKEKPRTAFAELASQLMRSAHQMPCYPTRCIAWCLCYEVNQRLKQLYLVYPNLYAQLKDFRYMMTRSQTSWLILHLTVIGSVNDCVADTRAAYLRRLVSVLSVVTQEAAPLAALMSLKEILRNDETAVSEWVSESLGLSAETGLVSEVGYKADEFAPDRSQAMSSTCWELGLMKCSISSSVRTAYKSLEYTLAQRLSDEENVDTADPLGAWELLTSEPAHQEDDVLPDSLTRSIGPAIRVNEPMRHSQSLTVLYRLLTNQTLKRAVRCKSRKTAEAVEDELASTVWDYNVRDPNLWKLADATHFAFPFREFLEPAFRPKTDEDLTTITSEEMVDG